MPTSTALLKDKVVVESIKIDIDWLVERARFELSKKGNEQPSLEEICQEVNKNSCSW